MASPGSAVSFTGSGGHNAWRTTLRQRLVVVAWMVGLWVAGIEARLVYLQIIDSADLVARAERQHERTQSAPAKRGDILDRRGRVLATSVDADTIYAVPTEIDDAKDAVRKLCEALGDCSAKDRQLLVERLGGRKAFAYVRRQVSPDQAQRVAALNLDGIGFTTESKRFYPNKELGAHLLGWVGIDNTGLSGLEYTYDPQIRGKPGTILIHTDARRHAFSRFERPPTSGSSVELTIDQYLQHIAERELHAGRAREPRRPAASAIVMNPQTGEILAMANEPTFNPNAYRDAEDPERRNRAVQDLYEPGSTFKVVTASAAIEEKVLPVDAGDRRQRRAHSDRPARRPRHARLRRALVHRRHRQVEQRRRDQDRVQARHRPAERIRPPIRLRPSGLARFPGRERRHRLGPREVDRKRARVGVDGLPGRRHAAADGGGGQRDRQRRRTTSSRASCARSTATTAGSRCSRRSLRRIDQRRHRGGADRDHGAGRRARHGDARADARLHDRRQDRHRQQAGQRPLFVGHVRVVRRLPVPSQHPAVTIIVVLDAPRGKNGHFGGPVSAPIFKRIAEATLRYLGIGPSINPPSPSSWPATDRKSRPRASPRIRRLSGWWLTTTGTMPDLSGMSAREALRTLVKLGLTARLSGDGFVVVAGTRGRIANRRRSDLRLVLERSPVRRAVAEHR